jgi:hypothetical protein
MTDNEIHAAVAVAYELEPGKWAFQLEDGNHTQLGYWEFAADGPFHADVVQRVVTEYLEPHNLTVDGAEAWEDHAGRWSAIIDAPVAP